MIKKGLKIFISLKRTQQGIVQKSLPQIYSSFVRWNSTNPAQSAGRLPIIINDRLNKAEKIEDLMFIHSKYRTYMNFINYSILLKQLTHKIKNENNQIVKESFYNDIVKDLISKIEREGVEDPRTLSTLYHHINRLSFKNSYSTRCNFILEQKGIEKYTEMKPEELSSFAHTLAKNGKKAYFQTIFSHICKNLSHFDLRVITTTLYNSCTIELKTPEMAKQFESYFLSLKETKMSAQDFSFIFYYCGKNSDVMQNPEFFEKLEKAAKFQVNYCTGIALTNIFHGLSFYDKQMMSSEFYEIFEPRILHLLPQLSNQGLSLILRGYCMFDQGSDLLYHNLIKEAIHRLGKLDPEAFTTIFYLSAKTKKISPELIEAFTNELLKGKLFDLLPKHFEHIFYSYFNLHKDDIYFANKQLKQAFSKYINRNIQNFSIQKLGNIAHMCPLLLEKSDQVSLSLHIQNLINDLQSINIDEFDLKSVCEITYFVFEEVAEPSEGFVTKILDLSLPLAQKKIIEKEELSTLHFLRYYGKLLAVLSSEKNLSESDSQKRRNLFELIEQWLIQAYQENPRVPEDFEVESILMNFITGFYNVLGSPSEEIKVILREALNAANLGEFKAENTKFLAEKTDLVENLFTWKRRVVESSPQI